MPLSALGTRFARQAVLPGFGRAGQDRLAAARVVVAGAGGLGSAVLPVLVAAGVGEVVVVDDDVVEVSNLPRQTLHTAADAGRAKVDSALDALRPLAGGAVHGVRMRVDASNAAALVAGAHVVVDATDSPTARYALDDAAAAAGVPLIWGSALGWTGQVGVAWAARGPRWRDLFPHPPLDEPDACAVAGVLPSLCTTVGGLMATEVLKVLTDAGEPLLGRVLVVDARRATVREIRYGRSEHGAEMPGAHAAGPDADAAASRDDSAARLDDAATPRDEEDRMGAAGVSVQEVEAALERGDDVQLVDVREPWEAEIASLPGATLIPLGSLAERAGELDPARAVIAYCHAGVRSQRAADALAARGFDVRTMAGGIDAWSREVDPSVPRY